MEKRFLKRFLLVVLSFILVIAGIPILSLSPQVHRANSAETGTVGTDLSIAESMSNVTQALIIAHSNPPEIIDHQPIIKMLEKGKGSDPVFPVYVHWSRDDANMGIAAFYAVMGLIITQSETEHVVGVQCFAVGPPGDDGIVIFLVNLTELRVERPDPGAIPWEWSGPGDWNWSAYINVADETAYDSNLDNNRITDNWASILGPGDIYWKDKEGLVDVSDMVLFVNANESAPGDPRWNWYADLNGDNLVDDSDQKILFDLVAMRVYTPCKKVPIKFELHDVAVYNVITSKDGCIPVPVVGQGHNVTLRVTAENQGDFAETFGVTFYANTTAIETKTITNLAAHTQILLTFTWNTTGFTKGNYTIKAVANIVEYEIDVMDNTGFANMRVLVSIPGDVNGDHLVDISDLVITVNAIPSAPGWPNWNPNADINNDGVVDVGDLVICVGNIPSGPW